MDRPAQPLACSLDGADFAVHFDVEERLDAIVTELRFPEDLERETRARILELFGA